MAEARASWRPPVTSVSVTAWPGEAAALAARVQAAFGLALPAPGRWTAAGGMVAVWLGPGHWQVEQDGRPDLAEALADAVGAHGGVIDVSDARAVLRLSGPGSRDVLARLLPLDLHPRAFAPGCAASSVAAHLSVQLRQIDDAPSYDLGCLRGYAGSLAHAVAEAGAVLDTSPRHPPGLG